MENITEKVKSFLVKNNLLSAKIPILVAFSGGYDSMCLLEIVSKLRKNVIAVHLNHNWRGEESDREEENCRAFCDSKNIEFYTEKLPQGTPKTETFAREARYTFFEKCAKQFKAIAVLTAHNLNDNAETIIYRIIKGTGLTGLCGISEQRGIFYRPLLDVSRADIEEFCRENNLNPNNDSSNENTKYNRNLIRKKILPIFEKINPNVIQTLNTLAANAQNDNEIVCDYISKLSKIYNSLKFATFSKPVKYRIIYNLLNELDIDCNRQKIELILEFIDSNKTSKSGQLFTLNEKLFLFANKDKIIVVPNREVSQPEIKVKIPNTYTTVSGDFTIKPYEGEKYLLQGYGETKAYVDLSGREDLVLRLRKDGDVIKPLGCSGSQKLKKYLNEKEVPCYLKNEMVFLAEGNEILWAPTLGLNDKIKVVTKPTHVLEWTGRCPWS